MAFNCVDKIFLDLKGHHFFPFVTTPNPDIDLRKLMNIKQLLKITSHFTMDEVYWKNVMNEVSQSDWLHVNSKRLEKVTT